MVQWHSTVGSCASVSALSLSDSLSSSPPALLFWPHLFLAHNITYSCCGPLLLVLKAQLASPNLWDQSSVTTALRCSAAWTGHMG